MRGVAISILVILLTMTFLQPLIETANLFKEKVALETALLNSCRAARNNSLVRADDPYDTGISDLNAYIGDIRFSEYFADAFSGTLELDVPASYGNHMSFTSSGNRWNRIDVSLESNDYDAGGEFTGRNMTILTLKLQTDYIFRTGLLRTAVGAAGRPYTIELERSFLVQMMN